ncbi:hypothetical protein KKH82_03785 [Patescibacteria group bacterium]|nr:hypothetical protein [Patescibacteria group bacterium]
MSGSASNTYSIYGYITYTLTEGSESLQSYLAAGTKLNHTDNTMDPGLAENFQYFNNTTPL